MEVLSALEEAKVEVKQYETLLSAAKERLKAIEAEMVNGYKGLCRYTHGEKIECNRSIREVLSRPKTISEICDALPLLSRSLIENQLKELVGKKAVYWNGKRGPASKYRRIGG